MAWRCRRVPILGNSRRKPCRSGRWRCRAIQLASLRLLFFRATQTYRTQRPLRRSVEVTLAVPPPLDGYRRQDLRYYVYLEIHRTGETADMVRAIVNRRGFRNTGTVCNDHAGMKDYAGELTRAVAMFDHLAGSLIGIFGNDDSGICAEVKYPKHMAGRQ